MNHLVSDFTIRLKNASRARKKEAVLPYSKLNKAVGDVLVKHGFLLSITEQTTGNTKTLLAELAYESRNPVLTDVEIVSKPSLRVYKKIKMLSPMERNEMVFSIVTTNKGVMTGKEADEKGVGGELLFRVW